MQQWIMKKLSLKLIECQIPSDATCLPAKKAVFFLKISKEIDKARRKSLTARAYLNTQKMRTVLQSKYKTTYIDL